MPYKEMVTLERCWWQFTVCYLGMSIPVYWLDYIPDLLYCSGSVIYSTFTAKSNCLQYSVYSQLLIKETIYFINKMVHSHDGGSVTYHLNLYTALLGQLSFVDINFEDRVQALTLLYLETTVYNFTCASFAFGNSPIRIDYKSCLIRNWVDSIHAHIWDFYRVLLLILDCGVAN